MFSIMDFHANVCLSFVKLIAKISQSSINKQIWLVLGPQCRITDINVMKAMPQN